MKRLLRGASALLVLVLLLAMAPTGLALATSREADILYTLGLIQGTGEGYEEGRAPTRAEALVLAVRLAGGEGKGAAADCPFTDVPAWAAPYAGWAYTSGLVNGTGEGTFSFTAKAGANDFAAMLLRLYGYDDREGAFEWAEATAFARHLGLIRSLPAGLFSRRDMFRMAYEAMTASPRGDEPTLLDRLAEAGAVESAVVNALGLSQGRELSGAEIYDKCLSAVFRMDLYKLKEEEETPDEEAEEEEPGSDGQASGFFIREDGIAVSNFHAFEEMHHAVITTESGKCFPVEDMISFSRETDLVVFRVSRTSLEGETVSAFPYLEVAGSDSIRNGETVYTLGTPLGRQNSISMGVVGYKNRPVLGFGYPMIQNTAPISVGSSGGALVNCYGQAIGSTCAYFVSGQNMNLAIPLDLLLILDLDQPGVSIPEMIEIVGPREDAEEEADS